MTAKRSEATPTIMGSTILSTLAVVTAASIAFPPRISTCRPACAASGWLVTTMPFRAITSDRLCAGQPPARTPRTALQNAGAGFDVHHGSVGATGATGADCADAMLVEQIIPNVMARTKNTNLRIIGPSLSTSRYG